MDTTFVFLGIERENPMPTVTATLTLKIGRRAYSVPSYADASRMFCAARDKSGLGASRVPTPLIYDANGQQVAYVSYNGRVWAGSPRDWQPGRTPLCEAEG
jgi:hypothetical protein